MCVHESENLVLGIGRQQARGLVSYPVVTSSNRLSRKTSAVTRPNLWAGNDTRRSFLYRRRLGVLRAWKLMTDCLSDELTAQVRGGRGEGRGPQAIVFA